MSGRRDADAYLEDMVLAAESVLAMTSGVSDEQMMDPMGPLRGHVLHQLTMFGEAAKHVSADVAEAHPEVPWDAIRRMRDRIVHHYFGIDDAVIVSTVRRSIPRDLPVLRRMLDDFARGS